MAKKKNGMAGEIQALMQIGQTWMDRLAQLEAHLDDTNQAAPPIRARSLGGGPSTTDFSEQLRHLPIKRKRGIKKGKGPGEPLDPILHGRIVDALRERPMTHQEILHKFTLTPNQAKAHTNKMGPNRDNIGLVNIGADQNHALWFIPSKKALERLYKAYQGEFEDPEDDGED